MATPTTENHQSALRPIERVVIRLRANGASDTEIARRVGKRPATVDRIVEMAGYRDNSDAPATNHRLRPVERVVLRLLEDGEGYGEIGNRLGRSGRHIRNIERFAHLKLAR